METGNKIHRHSSVLGSFIKGARPLAGEGRSSAVAGIPPAEVAEAAGIADRCFCLSVALPPVYYVSCSRDTKVM